MTDKGVAALRPRASRYAKSDPELRGHWIRIQPSGTKSFWTVARNPDGKQVWTFIGPADAMGIAESRDRARGVLQRVRAGLPAIAPQAETFGAVIDNWVKRHVEGNKLRSRDKINDLINRHISSEFRAREFTAIRRSDVAALLDEIEDDHSARQADAVLAIVRGVMNWYATRHDDYVPPLVKGMRRTDPKQRSRARTLDDDEIRAVWKTAEANGTYGALLRLLLLTAQRHSKVLTMKWADISPDGVWDIATAAREKGNAGTLVLPPVVRAIIDAQPRFADNPYVLAGRGGTHIASGGKYKQEFDAKLPADMRPWVLHDLRRTARSLMSRAGVLSEHAERVMGHAIGGIEGVYDRHSYFDEKADALTKLAALVDAIVRSHSADVVPMKLKGKRSTLVPL
jgi:integrase